MLFSALLMSGRVPSIICAAVAVIFSGVGRPAHAEVEYHLLASSSVGASDNPRAQSDQGAAGIDGFVNVSGQMDLGYVGRVTADRLACGITATSWFQDSQSSSLTQTARLSSAIQAGPLTNIVLRGGETWARLSMVDSAAPTDPQTSGPRPAGDTKFLGLDASESLTAQLGASWRLDQGLDGHWYRPIGAGGSSENKSATLGADIYRVWTRDELGLRTQLGAITSRVSRMSAETGLPESVTANSELAELSLSWQRDWIADLRHSLSAGAVVLRMNGSHVLPAGSASLLWHRTGNEIELRASTGASTNIYVGAAYQRSLVGLRIALPIDRLETLRVLVAADLEHDQSVGAPPESGGKANVAFARFAMQWQPGDMFSFGLEYMFRDQRASALDSGNASPSGGTTTGNSLFSTYRRQMALLTVGIQYPPSERR
jgi:hypothetical protein